MKKNNFLYSFFSIVIAVAVGVLAAYITMKIKEQTSYAVDISALIVSFIALVISIVTYFSIDKVNNITSMNGNVFENQNYSVATAELVEEFKDCKDVKAFSEKLLFEVSHPHNGNPIGKTASIIEFTDLLQNFIDHIIWFAYIEHSAEMEQKMDSIVVCLKKDLDKYLRLSNGIQYLINENFKLIKYVLLYQKSTWDDSYDENMENIRGRMLSNPVSQIVYYDYYGLCRRKQAKKIIEGGIAELPKDKLSAEYMLAVYNHEFKEDVVSRILFFLNQAIQCFDRATGLADEDILWKGYISYNRVRTEIQRVLITREIDGAKINEIESDLRNALKARQNVCILYGDGNNYLADQFHKEYKYTEILLNEFVIFERNIHIEN